MCPDKHRNFVTTKGAVSVATCQLCEQEQMKAYSCMKRMEGQIPFGEEMHLNPITSSCADCGVGKGAFHHSGCSFEACPKCHGQLLFCSCDVAEDYHRLTDNTSWKSLPRRVERLVADGS